MSAQLDALHRRSVRLVADFDDLLFDGSPGAFPSVLQGRSNANIVGARIGIYRRGLARFDAYSASTAPLVAHLRAIVPGTKAVHLVPNGLSRAWVTAGRAAARAYREGDPRTLRYLAGSPTHDVDLAMIAPALARFLAAHRDVRLELAGHFDRVPDELPADRISLAPVRPYMLLPMLLAPTWVSLAPLVDTAFSRCKSDVKFLEAAAFGAPTVASASVVYRRYDGKGLTACPEPDDWFDALVAMTDPAARARASELAIATVEERGFAHLGALSRVLRGEEQLA